MQRREIQQNHVKVFDTTLRDGFQAPGVNVGPKGRLEVAQMLARMNVDIIEAGFPISSQANFESVSAIALAVRGPVIAGLSRANFNDIDRTWAAIEPASREGGARIHTFLATSPIHMEHKLRMTPEQVVAKTREAVSHAKRYTDDVEFSPEDATRSDLDFLKRVVLTAVDAGATTINIPDTVGYTNPFRYPQLIADIKRSIDEHVGEGLVVVSSHCHNDRGLATINSLAAVLAGARQVEVSVNGIGERVGNAPFEEVVANFLLNDPDLVGPDGKPLYTQVDPSLIFRMSELVDRVSGIAVAKNKPIVGGNAFSHESGIHAAGVLANPETYEVFKPEMFGDRRTTIVIGGESGHAGIVSRADELGFQISDRAGLTTRVKNYANEVKRPVADTEIEKIAAELMGEKLVDRFQLVHIETHGVDHESNSDVTMSIDGQKYRTALNGNGQIEASVRAIKYLTGLNIDIARFDAHSLKEGADAAAGVTLTVKNGIEITAYAEDESVPLAAVNAYVAALNTIDRIKQRKEAKSNKQKEVFVAEENTGYPHASVPVDTGDVV